MTEPLMDLETLIERPKITIDKKSYDIISPEELSVVAGAKVARLGRRLDTKMKADHATEADEDAMKDVLAELTAIIMAPVPTEIRSKLGDAQKLAVIEVFTMLLLARKAKLAGGTMVKQLAGKAFTDLVKPEPKKTGEK